MGSIKRVGRKRERKCDVVTLEWRGVQIAILFFIFNPLLIDSALANCFSLFFQMNP